MKLTVRQASRGDIYRDLVRIPGPCRLSLKITQGAICKVAVAEHSTLVSVWGRKTKRSEILMDAKTRHGLGLEDRKAYDFDFRPVRWIGQCKWAWDAADPVYRIPVRLGVLSVTLGFVGLILGILGVFSK